MTKFLTAPGLLLAVLCNLGAAEKLNRDELNSVLNDLLQEEAKPTARKKETAAAPVKKEAVPVVEKSIAPAPLSKTEDTTAAHDDKASAEKPAAKPEKKSFFRGWFTTKTKTEDAKKAPAEETKKVGWFSPEEKKTPAATPVAEKEKTAPVATAPASPAEKVSTPKARVATTPAKKQKKEAVVKNKSEGVKTYASIQEAPANANLYQNVKGDTFVDVNTVPAYMRNRYTRNPSKWTKVSSQPEEKAVASAPAKETTLATRQEKVAKTEKPASSNWFANLGKKSKAPAEEAKVQPAGADVAETPATKKTTTAKNSDAQTSSWIPSFFRKKERVAQDKPAPAAMAETRPASMTSTKKEPEAKSGWFSSIWKKDKADESKATAAPAETNSKPVPPVAKKTNAPAPVARDKNKAETKPGWFSSIWKKDKARTKAKSESTGSVATAPAAAEKKQPMDKKSGFDFLHLAKREQKVTTLSYVAEHNIAVVEKVDGFPQGPFARPRQCIIELVDGGKTSTGLSVPFSEGDLLSSVDTGVRVLHKNHAKLTLDKESRVQLMNIETVDELTLLDGRARLNLLQGAAPWVIHADQARIYVAPLSDIVIDRTGDTQARISVLAGEVMVSMDLDAEPQSFTAGQDVFLDGQGVKKADVTADMQAVYKEQLPLADSDDYPAQLQLAIGHLQNLKLE